MTVSSFSFIESHRRKQVNSPPQFGYVDMGYPRNYTLKEKKKYHFQVVFLI